MKKETILFVVVALVAGFVIGLLAGEKSSGPGVPATSAVPAGPPPMTMTWRAFIFVGSLIFQPAPAGSMTGC